MVKCFERYDKNIYSLTLQEDASIAKLVSTDHEELYKNLLKPRIKVGNDIVVSNFIQPDVKYRYFLLQI